MKTPVLCETPAPPRHKPGLRRRLPILLRLAVRRLLQAERVETDSLGNPKTKPIRWLA
jgi:hypothetical protein